MPLHGRIVRDGGQPSGHPHDASPWRPPAGVGACSEGDSIHAGRPLPIWTPNDLPAAARTPGPWPAVLTVAIIMAGVVASLWIIFR